MTRRPRMPDDLFEVLEEKKDHRNQSIGEVLLKEFPELEDELDQDKKEEPFEEPESSLFDDTGLFE